MIHHGLPRSGGHIKHEIGKGSANGRVAHGTKGSGTISGGHAGLVPRITDSVSHGHKQLAAAGRKHHISKHEVRISGKSFSGRVKHGR